MEPLKLLKVLKPILLIFFKGAIHGFIELRLRRAAEITKSEFSAADWASLVLASFFASLFASTVAIFLFLHSALLTLFFAPVISLVVSFSIYSLPMLVAQSKLAAMEKELPSFVSHLLTVYSERKTMHEAVAHATFSSDYRHLGPELQEAFAYYGAGAPPWQAYARLTGLIESRFLNRTFDLIVRSLETGMDVAEPLAQLSADMAKRMELNSEKNSKVGLLTWMVSASSAFFYPLFVALGLVVIKALESLAAFSLYSPSEKTFVTAVLLSYLFVGVLLDASYNGQVNFRSSWRGVLTYSPPALLFAFSVFFLAYNGVNHFL